MRKESALGKGLEMSSAFERYFQSYLLLLDKAEEAKDSLAEILISCESAEDACAIWFSEDLRFLFSHPMSDKLAERMNRLDSSLGFVADMIGYELSDEQKERIVASRKEIAQEEEPLIE